MRKIAIILTLILVSGVVNAQSGGLTKKEEKALLKEQKKKEQAEAMAAAYEFTGQMINTGHFVLEADMLFDKYGQSYQVQSNLNFIMLDSIHGVIQVGDAYSLGQNGVGGVTIEGDVTDYEVKSDEKRHTYTASWEVRSPVGRYRVVLNASANGTADASISGSFSGRLRFSGNLVHPGKSRVFKGTSY